MARNSDFCHERNQHVTKKHHYLWRIDFQIFEKGNGFLLCRSDSIFEFKNKSMLDRLGSFWVEWNKTHIGWDVYVAFKKVDWHYHKCQADYFFHILISLKRYAFFWRPKINFFKFRSSSEIFKIFLFNL